MKFTTNLEQFEKDINKALEEGFYEIEKIAKPIGNHRHFLVLNNPKIKENKAGIREQYIILL